MKDETKEELKDLGLEGLEDLTEDAIDVVFKALAIVIRDSENKFDDVLLPVLPAVKTALLALANQINPKD